MGDVVAESDHGAHTQMKNEQAAAVMVASANTTPKSVRAAPRKKSQMASAPRLHTTKIVVR